MPIKAGSRTRILKSDIYQAILGFFLENEGSVDTPRGIATWIDASLIKVRVALEALAEMNCLKAHRTPSTIGYSCLLSKKELASLTSKISK
ncbi:MAG: hypothetical protein A3C47_01405 [Omnitrophica bacterium RIFCSPHIGHO2_02_FULL_51_18]|nr:MAG: hypothetical protein A3C47_01405 [Omnitrophica bacterium RIFCSPHIGHO2_02_FULL_51_18]